MKIINRLFLFSLLLFLGFATCMVLRHYNILHFSRPENMWLITLIIGAVTVVLNTIRKKMKEATHSDIEGEE